LHTRAKRNFGLAFLLGLTLIASPAVAGQGAPGDPPREAAPAAQDATAGGEPVYRQVGRELARLDERLDLGTFPDGSPLWPSRLAASLERLTAPASPELAAAIPGRELLRRLAEDLRALGAGGPLGGPPELQPAAASMPDGSKRAERLAAILETAGLLNRKLDAAERRGYEWKAAGAGRGSASRSEPSGEGCASATSIGLGTFTGSTLGAARAGSSAGAWFRFVATGDGPVTFDTAGSSYDTTLSLYSECPPAGAPVGFSDDAAGTTTASLSLGMESGQEVWLRLGGFAGDAGSFALQAAASGGLSGIATLQCSGTPLSGVTVKVYTDYGYYVTEAQTGADGTYEVNGLSAGTYYAGASGGGYLDEVYDGIVCAFDDYYCTPYYEGTSITVGSGVTGGVDFAMVPGASIAGTLTEEGTGDPLTGYAGLYSVPSGDYLTSVVAGVDGSYELTGLPPGKYYVEAEASDHRSEVYDDVACVSVCDVTTGNQLGVTSGAALTGIDFALTKLGTISGTVTDQSTGDPIAGLELDVFSSQGTYLGYAGTASDGTYQLPGLSAGTFFVRTYSATGYNEIADYRDELYDDISCDGGCPVTSGTPIPVTLGATTSGIDFALIPLGRISGVVRETGTGSPLAGIEVGVYSTPAGDWVSGTITGSDGSYLTPHLPTGTYHLATSVISDYRNEVYDDIPCGYDCDAASGTPVAVSNGSTTSGIDFALDPEGRIAGTVTAAGDGSPLQSVSMAFVDSGGFTEGYASTAADGTYLSPRLPSGTYFVKARGSAHGYLDEVYEDLPCPGSCDPTTGTPLAVTLSTTISGIDFALDPLGGIAGDVTAADTGGPLEAQIVVLDSTGHPEAYSYTSAGHFEIQNLAPGPFFLKAVYTINPDQYEDRVYDGVPCEPGCDLSLATPLQVPAGATLTGIDLALDRCSLDSYADLLALEIVGSYTAEACERVSAEAVTIAAGSDVVFRSGREIVLGNGFRVEPGATFKALVEPELVQP